MKSKSFRERRRELLPDKNKTSDTEQALPVNWNNFPNYFKFGAFANATPEQIGDVGGDQHKS